MLKKNCTFRCISAWRCLSVTTHKNSLMWWVRSYESSSWVINCHCCGKSIRRESGGKFRNEVIIPHHVVLFHVRRRSSSPPASVGKAKQSEVNLLSFPNRKNDKKNIEPVDITAIKIYPIVKLDRLFYAACLHNTEILSIVSIYQCYSCFKVIRITWFICTSSSLTLRINLKEFYTSRQHTLQQERTIIHPRKHRAVAC